MDDALLSWARDVGFPALFALILLWRFDTRLARIESLLADLVSRLSRTLG